MSVNHSRPPRSLSPLALTLPGWKLDKRELIWLWYQLREDMQLEVEDFSDRTLPVRIATFLTPMGATRLTNKRAREMPSIRLLERFEGDRRATTWMRNELRLQAPQGGAWLPRALEPWDELIALIDLSDGSVEEKLAMIEGLTQRWARHLHDDQYFRWLKGLDEKRRCGIAWDWYSRYGKSNPPAPRFQSYEDIACFWDATIWKVDEKRLHLEQIKKYWKNLQIKESQAGKKQTNVLLSNEATAALDYLTTRWGMTKKEVFDKLLRDAARDAEERAKPHGDSVG